MSEATQLRGSTGHGVSAHLGASMRRCMERIPHQRQDQLLSELQSPLGFAIPCMSGRQWLRIPIRQAFRPGVLAVTRPFIE